MAKFQYIALDGAGQEQRGTIEAGDRAAAIAAIRASGLFPSAIGEVKGGSSSGPAGKKGAKAAKAEKERRQKYFHDAAVQAAIERRKSKES